MLEYIILRDRGGSRAPALIVCVPRAPALIADFKSNTYDGQKETPIWCRWRKRTGLPMSISRLYNQEID
jgi:hypothetical protein